MTVWKMSILNFAVGVSVLMNVQIIMCMDNPVSLTDEDIKTVTLNGDLGYSVNRTKRNLNLLGINTNPTNSNPQNTEGLLASCQLTNLLLYQVLQQRQAQGNPFLSQLALGSGTTANVQQSGLGSLLQPFPPAVNQNLILPGATVSTYITTSTFVTKLTTTAVITIPLLFGNKPVPTTVTRTKIYDVTTSTVQTLTTTIQPPVVTATQTTVTALLSTKTVSLEEEDVSVDYYGNNIVDKTTGTQEFAENVRVDQQTPAAPKFSDIQAKANRRKGPLQQSVPTTKAPSNKRRKNRLNSPAATTPAPKSYTRDRTAAYKYPREQPEEYPQSPSRQPEGYGQTQRKQFTLKSNYEHKRREEYYQVEEDPTAVQYPDDYSYYTRRLKRGEQFEDEEEAPLAREYLLEPSSDGDFSSGYQNFAEKCPPIPKNQGVTVTVTHTETRTVTKLVNPSSQNSQTRGFVTPSRVRSYQERGITARARTPATTPKSYDNLEEESHNDRRTARYRSRGSVRYNNNGEINE